MVSGALVNFVLLWISGPFVGLMILSGVFFAFLAWFSFATTGIKMTVAVILVSLAWLAVTGTTDLRAMTERFLYPGQHVVSDSETPYGQVVVTRNAGQFNFYGNGMLMCSTGNGIGNEENVHYALLQRPAPRSILLISGGFTGTLAEILKYRPSRVDYVELNPSLVAIAARYTRQLNDPAIAVHETDARRFIRATSARYDVILINVPAPSSLQVNRYYTLEFLAEARHHMNPGAVISFSLPSGGDYVSRQAGLLNSVLWNTLKTYFKNVLVVPGGRNYFLASDAPLSIDIPSLVRERGIETDYVNGFYLDAEQLRERSAGITPKDSPGLAEPEVNRDFHPVAAWYHVSWWMSLFNLKPLAVLLFFLAVMVFMAVTLNPMSTGLFTAGFTLASTEMILVFALQVLCGYLFQAVGALIMVFMLGLAAGSGMSPGKKTGNSLGSYRLLQVLTGLLALAVPLILHGLSLAGTGDIPVMAVIAVLAFSMAFITGREYTLATLLSGKTVTKTVASTYSAELFGSAAGAFAVALFLIPAIGIIRTGVLLALLNFISAGSLYFLKSKN
jgi:spermidine synthase